MKGGEEDFKNSKNLNEDIKKEGEMAKYVRRRVWVPGYWKWVGKRRVWVKGHYTYVVVRVG